MLKRISVRKESLRFSVLTAALLVALASPAQDLPTLSEILEVHNRRVEPFRSLIVTWEGTETVKVGGVLAGYPKESKSIKNDGEMIVQGSSVSVRRELDTLSGSNIVRGTVILEVFRDGIGKFYMGNIKHGWVLASNPAMGHLVTKELLKSIRPDPEYLNSSSMNLRGQATAGMAWRYTVLRREDTPEGPMIVVGNTNDQKTRTIDWYLDESRDYIVTRMLSKRSKGQITSELKIRYAEDTVLDYVPREIEYSEADRYLVDVDKREWKWIINRTKKLTVTSLHMNVPIDEAIFELEFPPGTAVSDLVAGTAYMAGETTPEPKP